MVQVLAGVVAAFISSGGLWLSVLQALRWLENRDRLTVQLEAERERRHWIDTHVAQHGPWVLELFPELAGLLQGNPTSPPTLAPKQGLARDVLTRKGSAIRRAG
jgi:hypothetical protein